MKLSHLSDQSLLQQTFLLVKKEKEILSEILLHLREVQKRRLFCELGFGSLFQYCVKQLGYSEDQAYRRINAIKMVREIPEIQEQIALGQLSLSTLSVAQSLFKADATVDKKEVLKALRNKSKREAEVIVRDFSPKVLEKKREHKFSLSQAQEEKWIAVKAKLAHSNLSQEEILEKLCDLFLAPKPTPKTKSPPEQAPMTAPKPAPILLPPRSSALFARANSAIATQTKRLVFQQSRHQCENCKSTFALQIDHKIPRALGGTNHPSNLRLLCRSCNQRAAIKIFGEEKMQKYLEKS